MEDHDTIGYHNIIYESQTQGSVEIPGSLDSQRCFNFKLLAK